MRWPGCAAKWQTLGGRNIRPKFRTTTDPNGGLHVAVEMPQRTWWHHDQFGVDVNHLNSINTDLWVNSFPADQ